jgi:hypothetical protein
MTTTAVVTQRMCDSRRRAIDKHLQVVFFGAWPPAYWRAYVISRVCTSISEAGVDVGDDRKVAGCRAGYRHDG